MAVIHFSDAMLTVDAARGCATALSVGTKTLLASESPLFRFCIRRPNSETQVFSAVSGKLCREERGDNALCISYSDFDDAGITLTLCLSASDGALNTSVSAQNAGDNMLEWVEVLPLILPKLRGEGGPLGGEMLYPYNEGAIIDSVQMRQATGFCSMEPEYPSMGSFPVFPNMICSQMMAYLYDGDNGRSALYFGAHDEKRGVKGIDFKTAGDGVEMIFRYYCGVEYGADYEAGFPLVIKPVNGEWEAAAEIYRAWFDENLPKRLT
ncbi:MAG: hypothetical protein IKZ09_05710, partial [Clostridia bacterium]|nr:hypothetical protein [Clostridia bacterium]